MAKDEIDELEKKKQELEEELNRIQGELDNSLDQVRDDVSTSLDPKSLIRRHPLPAVGGAALLGFLLGHRGRSSSSGRSSSGEISSTLISELKKLATRKAISFATDYVEEMLEKKAEKHLGGTNGREQE